ncbi:MAG: MarR family EPS-associated transcriptional regulator [Porticoccaceae bacterium]|nr:MarR family EPS-associated transcriptional regulator [Porticoccaceae bacterium]
MSDEIDYKALKLIEENPSISQRDLARNLGVSLGKVNYCLKALIEKGFVKANNFRNQKNKLGYAYLLTPKGIEAKTSMTVTFLKRKMVEYEALRREIEQLEIERRRTETQKKAR